MRSLKDHIITNGDSDLKIFATDKSGAGGANHRYEITGFNTSTNPSSSQEEKYLKIFFQNGTILENGVNGVTQEALLTVIIDRLRCFQAGEFACRENACALTHLEEALHWMQQRTISRMRRGVEGKHQK